MMKRYRVEATKQPIGIRWAVLCEGQYRFLLKTKEEADRIAGKLNDIYERRTLVT